MKKKLNFLGKKLFFLLDKKLLTNQIILAERLYS